MISRQASAHLQAHAAEQLPHASQVVHREQIEALVGQNGAEWGGMG